MTYEELMDRLHSVDVKDAFPMYVPSILRPAHSLYMKIITFLPDWYKRERITYVTRLPWVDAYRLAQPDIRIRHIPGKYEYPGYGLDTTRMAIHDLAIMRGDKYILDWDDDIEILTASYSHGDNTRRLTQKDRQKYAMQIIGLISETAREAFEKYPTLCLGRLNRITPAVCTKEAHRTKICIQGMGVPRTTTIVAVNRMADLGIRRTGAFDKHCEDIGQASSVLMNGGQVFTLPTILFEPTFAEDTPRTEIRLFGDELKLWQSGERALKELGIGEYLTYSSKKVAGHRVPININLKKWNTDNGLTRITEDW